MQTDLHQHLWTQPLLNALADRHTYPFVERTDEGLTVLHCAGEAPWVVDAAGQEPARRRRQMVRDGAERAVVAISSPIGIEALAPSESAELIAAHLDGVLALGPSFLAWGPIAVAEPDPVQVDRLCDRGCAGISIPAGAISDPAGLDAMLPVLDRARRRDLPVLVHPGPGAAHRAAAPRLDEPLWWPALTGYVAQMQGAWLSFTARGRRELPNLRVVFAALAAGAPLLAERLTTRGGPAIDLRDPDTYYDTSSFGPQMVETMARWVGPGQLVYGSDRPVIEPIVTGREVELMATAGNLFADTAVLIAAAAA